IDRELALEKEVKELNNIMFKRNQSAQTVHMLTKPQVFYNHATRQALGFQNPCYFKKAQQLKPNLYDGSVIGKSDVVVVPDCEDTLMHAEESRLSHLQNKLFGLNTQYKLMNPIFLELFTSFDQCLIDEVTEVQNIFKQMELAVEQRCAEKTKFQTKMDNVLKENDRLLTQALGVEIVNIVVHDYVKFDYLNVDACAHCRDIVSSSESDPIFAELFKINDLKAQEKVLVITALKEQLNKLKGKVVLTDVVSLNPIDHALLQVDVALLVPKLHKNRTAHTDYIRHTQEEAATLREIVESERLLSPLNTSLDYACKYTRWIQELLMILQQTCPSFTDLGTKLVAVTPKNKPKQIRRTVQLTKSERTTVATSPSANIDSNTPVLSSTGVTLVSSASESKNVKSSLNKASVVDTKATSSVIKSVSNVNSNLKCASFNGCLFSDNHDACVVEYINSVNASKKSKFVKTPVKRKVWKSTGKVFKTVGYIWKPTGRTFTLVGNVCPLTRIATATIVPHREPILIVKSTDKPVATLKFLGTVKFGNDHVAKIMGYGDYQIRNVTISQVYYVEGLGHNLFSIGQFCDSDLEVAFHQHTCFIHTASTNRLVCLYSKKVVSNDLNLSSKRNAELNVGRFLRIMLGIVVGGIGTSLDVVIVAIVEGVIIGVGV
nr:integrase, catalytic region, zinc finger, CCHC-type, peptidase aspartic, catalytic [Tanacetum cinerariifolium]